MQVTYSSGKPLLALQRRATKGASCFITFPYRREFNSTPLRREVALCKKRKKATDRGEIASPRGEYPPQINDGDSARMKEYCYTGTNNNLRCTTGCQLNENGGVGGGIQGVRCVPERNRFFLFLMKQLPGNKYEGRSLLRSRRNVCSLRRYGYRHRNATVRSISRMRRHFRSSSAGSGREPPKSSRGQRIIRMHS